MGKTAYKRLKGSQSFRQRLLLATLSSTPILIEDIRADETWPGLRSHEISLLRLFETVSDDCHVEINETGTKLKYKPGTIMGGRQHRPHDCGVSRSIGYFLEPLVLLSLFAKQPLTIRLKGIIIVFLLLSFLSHIFFHQNDHLVRVWFHGELFIIQTQVRILANVILDKRKNKKEK